MYFLIDQSALIFIAASLMAITLGTGLNHNGKATLLTALPDLAFIGMYAGLVIMLGNMSDPADVPVSLAVACLPALYSFVVYLLLEFVDLSTANEHPEPRTKQRRVGAVIFVAVLLYLTSANQPAFLDTFTMALVLAFLSFIALTRKISGGDDLLSARDLLPSIGMVIGAIGSVVALANIDDPKAIGPALAVSYLGVIYTSVIRIFWLILQPETKGGSTNVNALHFTYGRLLLPIITVAILLISLQLQK